MNKTRSGPQAVEAMKGKQSGEIWTRNPKNRKMKQGRNVITQHRAATVKGMKSEAGKGFGGINAIGLIDKSNFKANKKTKFDLEHL